MISSSKKAPGNDQPKTVIRRYWSKVARINDVINRHPPTYEVPMKVRGSWPLEALNHD